jgi:hypothetical protein
MKNIWPPAVMVKGISSSFAVLVLMTIAAYFLTGCASQHAPAVIKVDVPMAIPCNIQPISKPQFAVDSISPDSDIWDMMSALRAERIQRKSYESVLESAIHSCQ